MTSRSDAIGHTERSTNKGNRMTEINEAVARKVLEPCRALLEPRGEGNRMSIAYRIAEFDTATDAQLFMRAKTSQSGIAHGICGGIDKPWAVGPLAVTIDAPAQALEQFPAPGAREAVSALSVFMRRQAD